MIVLPLARSIGLKAATTSPRAATLPMFVRSRPSRTPGRLEPRLKAGRLRHVVLERGELLVVLASRGFVPPRVGLSLLLRSYGPGLSVPRVRGGLDDNSGRRSSSVPERDVTKDKLVQLLDEGAESAGTGHAHGATVCARLIMGGQMP